MCEREGARRAQPTPRDAASRARAGRTRRLGLPPFGPLSPPSHSRTYTLRTHAHHRRTPPSQIRHPAPRRAYPHARAAAEAVRAPPMQSLPWRCPAVRLPGRGRRSDARAPRRCCSRSGGRGGTGIRRRPPRPGRGRSLVALAGLAALGALALGALAALAARSRCSARRAGSGRSVGAGGGAERRGAASEIAAIAHRKFAAPSALTPWQVPPRPWPMPCRPWRPWRVRPRPWRRPCRPRQP